MSVIRRNRGAIVVAAAVFVGLVVVNVVLRAQFEVVVNDASSLRVAPRAPLDDIRTWLLDPGRDLFYRPIEHWLETAEWLWFGENWLPGNIIHAVILGAVAVMSYMVVMETARDRVQSLRLRIFIAAAAAVLYATSFRMIEVTWLIFQKSMLTELYVLPGLLCYLRYVRTGRARWLLGLAIPGVLGPLTRELPGAFAGMLAVIAVFSRKRDYKFALVVTAMLFMALFPVFLPSLLLSNKLDLYTIFGLGMQRGLLIQEGLASAGNQIHYTVPFRSALFYSPLATVALLGSVAVVYWSRALIGGSRRDRWIALSALGVLSLTMLSIYSPDLPVVPIVTSVLFTTAVVLAGWRYGAWLGLLFLVPMLPWVFIPIYDVWVRVPALAFIIITLLWLTEVPDALQRLYEGSPWRRPWLPRRLAWVASPGSPYLVAGVLLVFQLPNLPMALVTHREYIETHKQIADWLVAETPPNTALVSNLRQTFDIDYYSDNHVTAYYAPFIPERLPPYGPMPGGRGKPVAEVLFDRLALSDAEASPIYFMLNEDFGRLGLPQLPPDDLRLEARFNVKVQYPVLDPLRLLLPPVYAVFGGPTDLGFQATLAPGFLSTTAKSDFELYRFVGTFESFARAYDDVPAMSGHNPRRWGEYLGFNVVADGETLHAIRRIDGAYNVDRLVGGDYPVALSATTFGEIKQRILQYSNPGRPVTITASYRGFVIVSAYGNTYAVPADEVASTASPYELPELTIKAIPSESPSSVLTGTTVGDVLAAIHADPQSANYPNLIKGDPDFEVDPGQDSWEGSSSTIRRIHGQAKTGEYSLRVSATTAGLPGLPPPLLADPAFKSDSPAALWTTFDSTVQVDGSITRAGRRSLKIVADKATRGDAGASQDVFDPRYRGDSVTFGAWVLAPSTNNQTQALGIWDGVGVTYSEAIPRDGEWHRVSVTRQIDEEATELRAYGYVLAGSEADTDDVLYLTAPAFVQTPVTAGASQDVFRTALRGHTVMFGAWLRAPSTNDRTQTLGISDGVGVTLSTPVPRDDDWHWVTVTREVDPAATELRALVNVLTASDPDGDDVLYVDAAYLLPEIPLGNSGFEDGTVRWEAFDAAVDSERSIARNGDRSLKITAKKPTSGDAGASQIVPVTEYRGRSVTFGAWALAPATNDQRQALGIWDGVSVTYGPPIQHDGQWHWTTVTKLIDPDATELRAYAYVLSGTPADTDDVLYVDSATLVKSDRLPPIPPVASPQQRSQLRYR